MRAGLPENITYDETSQTVYLGTGTFGPVPERVWTYDVGGMKVVKHWFDYRKTNPGGKKSAPWTTFMYRTGRSIGFANSTNSSPRYAGSVSSNPNKPYCSTASWMGPPSAEPS